MIFILSAVAKLAGADNFELYVFSLGVFSLGASFIIARLVIALELFLGVWLMVNTHPKAAIKLAVALLAAFSAFLVVLIVKGSKDNCHCFGDLIDFTPVQSLVKNAVLAAVAALSLKVKPFNIPRRNLIAALAGVSSLAAVFIISPPDNLMYKSYAIDGFNQDIFDKAVADGLIDEALTEGDDLTCFFSFNCEFCHMTAKKLSIMLGRGAFEGATVNVLVGGKYEDFAAEAAAFFADSQLPYNSLDSLPANTFLHITNGHYPVVIHTQDGRLLEQWSYRDLH
ncbi:MAG: hypothetical protein J6P50_09065 [Bacteroidales bacterium]|nr:hypothetical protein [Bacteroidales bacterium]